MEPRVPRGHGPHEFGESSYAMLPFIGNFVFLLLILGLVLLGLYLWRQGKLPLPTLGRRRPEEEAKSILAERFARGDISTDEFLERSSTLNWPPGVERLPSRPSKKRRG